MTLGKPATMSSLLRSTVVASHGNDGVYIPAGVVVEQDEMMFQTEKQKNAWWRVDLQLLYTVSAVRILNRALWRHNGNPGNYLNHYMKSMND